MSQARQRQQLRLPPEVNRALYVRNLPFKITAEEMYDIFGKFGAIRQIRLGNASDTRGTAFVVYEDIFDAKNALDHLSGFNVCGRYLVVLYYQQTKMQKRLDTEREAKELAEMRQRLGLDTGGAGHARLRGPHPATPASPTPAPYTQVMRASTSPANERQRLSGTKGAAASYAPGPAHRPSWSPRSMYSHRHGSLGCWQPGATRRGDESCDQLACEIRHNTLYALIYRRRRCRTALCGQSVLCASAATRTGTACGSSRLVIYTSL